MCLFRTRTLHPVARMLSADSLCRVPLQALPSAAYSCFAKWKPLPGDRLNPMTGFMQYKGRSPLPQFGTVLKGHPNFRAPQGIAAASVATAFALQPAPSTPNFSCLSPLQMLFLRILPNKPPAHKFDAVYCFFFLTMGDKLLGGER